MRLSRFLYTAARAARDGEAVGQAVAEGSPAPIVRRIVNRTIGHFAARLLSGLWMR